MYVGVTTEALHIRVSKHRWAARNAAKTRLHRAMQETPDAFSCWPVAYADSKAEGYFIEHEWVQRLRAAGVTTYNETDGGPGTFGRKRPPGETPGAPGAAHPFFGKKTWMHGRRHTDEARAKMRAAKT